MKCGSYDWFFKNFANKTKLDIVKILRQGPLSVNHIAEKMKQEQSKISHNLKKLSSCNILTVKQKGKERIYSLNKETVIPLLKLVEKHVKKNCKLRCKE
ncbi:ArsR family transcriptional regulator [Candidatus Woesearchaeota archaeon]|nr:MAG: ArsR family transcriptional regulator [Candidatus Woesearchaeota archaeon]